jgi:hypothetical protein
MYLRLTIKEGNLRRSPSQWPALIGKTIESVVTENEMVEQPDTQQVSSFPQSCGKRPILRARRGISGGMIVLCGVASYVEFLHADAAIPA